MLIDVIDVYLYTMAALVPMHVFLLGTRVLFYPSRIHVLILIRVTIGSFGGTRYAAAMRWRPFIQQVRTRHYSFSNCGYFY